MLKLLTCTPFRPFCLNNRLNRIYDVTYQIKDVTMIRGMQSQSPYFSIEQQKIHLPTNKLIFEINEPYQNNPDLLMEFMDRDMNIYSITTPMLIVCSEPFFVRRRGNVYCVLNNLPIVPRSDMSDFTEVHTSPVVEAICKDSLVDLPDNGKETLSGPALHNLMVTNLLRHGMKFKMEKIQYKQLLKVVEREISIFDHEISQLQYALKRKANRRLRNYTTFLLFQYAVTHYYIYQHLSWDIMEPITVLFANFDLFVGYLFFVMRGREWSLGEMHGSYIDQKKYTSLKNNGVDVEKYDELLKIREYLKFRLALLSKNPYELMENLEKSIKLLDTR